MGFNLILHMLGFVAKWKRFLRVMANLVKEISTQELTASVPKDLEMPVSFSSNPRFHVLGKLKFSKVFLRICVTVDCHKFCHYKT